MAFGLAAVARAWPFVDDVTPALSAGDDWLTYKTFAESVLNGGLAMPGVAGDYAALPHGFLYVYFLALVFAATGANAAFAYVVQGALLGASVGLMWAAFRRGLPMWLGVGLLFTLVGLAWLDVYRVITFRLLSENLYFPLAAALWFLLLRRSAHTSSASVGAGVLLGLTVLTRPSTIMAAWLVLAVVVLHGVRSTAWRHPVLLVLGFGLGLSPAVLRDWAATGHLGFQLVSNTRDWIRIWDAPLGTFLTTLAKRTAFALGWTSWMVDAFRPRPHWMALWALAALYLPLKRARREPLAAWEGMVVLYVIGYLGPVILVADISSYGGRMIVTVLPLVTALAFGSLRLLLAPRLSR